MNLHKTIITCLLAFALLSTPIATATTFTPSQIATSSTPSPLPCSLILTPVDKALTPNTYGVALISTYRRRFPETSPAYQERTSISMAVNRLPMPSTYGDFDGYAGFAVIPGKVSWTFPLLPKQDSQMGATWAGRSDEISATLTPNTRVQVRLYNSKQDTAGAVLLQGTLMDCKVLTKFETYPHHS